MNPSVFYVNPKSGFLAFGRVVLGSDNLGIFTYTLIQSLLQAVGISYLVCVMKKMKAPVWIRWFGLLFLTVFPLFPMWGFTMVKDAQYYISLLYFGVSFADILVDGTEKKKWWKQIVFLYSSYGMILCRKEGRCLLVGALICLFFYHKKQWKLYIPAGSGKILWPAWNRLSDQVCAL